MPIANTALLLLSASGTRVLIKVHLILCSWTVSGLRRSVQGEHVPTVVEWIVKSPESL